MGSDACKVWLKINMKRPAIYYDRARSCLEIAGDKGEYSEVWEDYWERVKKHEDEQSYLGRGKTSLLGSALEKAIEYFEEGADLYPSQAEDLWRWSWLAKGAFSIGVDNFRASSYGCYECA